MTLMRIIRAHEITEGMLIIPAGRTYAVEVIANLTGNHSEYIELACFGRGKVALRLHRDELVDLVRMDR